jgi:hypothetical protein
VYRTELFKKKLDPVSMTEIVNVPDMSGMFGQSIISIISTNQRSGHLSNAIN